MRVFELDEYSPEYNTLILRDSAGSEKASGPDPADGEPAGTIAGAGIGWLTAATHGTVSVRLESHDGPVPADHAGFDDVLETPYRAITAGLALNVMTGGYGGRAVLDLGGAGWYRVRVARRAGDGDRWLLRFWPDPAPEPPVWLVRSRPAVDAGDAGWTRELPGPAVDMTYLVGAAVSELGRAVSVDDVAEWVRAHRHPVEWFNSPLWPPGEPQITERADLDRMHAARHAQAVAHQVGMRRRLDEIATQLGVPPVQGRRDLLPLLAAAGLLVRDDAGRYSPGRPARVDTVLSLPPKRAQAVRERDAYRRYRGVAGDLVAVLRWARRPVLETTAVELARRLLVTEEQVRDILGFAEQTGMLHADSDQRYLWLRRGPRPAEPPAGERRENPARERAAPPLGAPPRAGTITADGVLVVWRDDVPVEVAYLGPAEWNRALETALGVLVLSEEGFPRLVADTGEVRIIDRTFPQNLALLGDGRRLAVVDGAHRLRIVDLAGAQPDAQPSPADPPVHLHGAHRDTVYFTDMPQRTTMRWTPGSEPEPCGHPVQEIDPYSGTLTWTTAQGVVVSRPDQPPVTVPVGHPVQLAPGGDLLWTTWSRPPSLRLFPVAAGPRVEPRVLDWPDDPHEAYKQLIWEDTEHVLITKHAPASGLRLSVHDGAIERLPLAGALILVEPWVRPANRPRQAHSFE